MDPIGSKIQCRSTLKRWTQTLQGGEINSRFFLSENLVWVGEVKLEISHFHVVYFVRIFDTRQGCYQRSNSWPASRASPPLDQSHPYDPRGYLFYQITSFSKRNTRLQSSIFSSFSLQQFRWAVPRTSQQPHAFMASLHQYNATPCLLFLEKSRIISIPAHLELSSTVGWCGIPPSVNAPHLVPESRRCKLI